LIVFLLIKTFDEVGKDKRFGNWGLEIFGQVEFGERFLSDIGSQGAVLSQVLGVDQTITVDTFGLVDPQFDKHVGFLDAILSGDKETLEDVGQVTDVELVVEVLSGLTEGTLDITVQLEGGLDDWDNQLSN